MLNMCMTQASLGFLCPSMIEQASLNSSGQRAPGFAHLQERVSSARSCWPKQSEPYLTCLLNLP